MPRFARRNSRFRSRRASRKGRSYRKPVSRSRRAPRRSRGRVMSTRALLNKTSRKKRNTMLQYANTSTINGTSVPIGPGQLVVNGNAAVCLFSPTAMDLNDGTGAPGSVVQQAVRTSTAAYMKGFSEHIRIQTSTGLPWFWRRITFCSKRPQIFNSFQSTDTPSQNNSGNTSYVDTTNGMERLYFNQVINSAPNTIAAWYAILFKGERSKDWADVLTAQVDTSRVDLKSDRSVTIKSGNASGTVRDFKLWYPMNKNLVYDDDESGDLEASSYLSVQDKRGMGDFYILDFFYTGTGGTTNDFLQLTSTSTMYWHEK
uniref:Putative capsid protein n=1 Tax=Turdus hortulorum Genomoviridae sp. TaxID=2814995 RepID=A0A8A4XDI7_9VIRU|nr:MAG: capsid protein [Gemykibivirus]